MSQPHASAPRIAVAAGIRFGRPVIARTRVPAAPIIAKLAGGMTAAEVAAEYGLCEDKVRAALAYAADLLAMETARKAA